MAPTALLRPSLHPGGVLPSPRHFGYSAAENEEVIGVAFEMRLWEVKSGGLQPLPASLLDQEERLEHWIAEDPSILGMSLAVIGRQVPTEHGGRIDLLAIDDQGSCVIIELKRGRTPRDVIAQLLDYASWVAELEYSDLDQLAQRYAGKSLAAVYQERFDGTLPETVNNSHNLVVVAAELDESSERILNYLADHHGVSINAVFFTFFASDGTEFLGRAWLRDPAETIERSESRKRPPWSGYWFVNVGEGSHRNWDDNRRYGYIGSGGGPRYSSALQNLDVGDKLFAYMKGLGYVGYGEVTKVSCPIKEFEVDEQGKRLLELPLTAPRASENADVPDLTEWAVGVRWVKTVGRDEAKTFKGAFANQNIVCKLRDPRTLEFLRSEFGAE
jgi:hypothetical protein